MERIEQREDDIVELGIASVETLGNAREGDEPVLTHIELGISAD